MIKKDVINKKDKKVTEDEKIEEESKNKKETKSKKKLTLKQIQNKQAMWAIILMISVILIIILVPIITKNFINKFVYLKLDWQKTKLGKIPFYSTKVPIINDRGTIVEEYLVNLRNNPKKLEDVKITFPEDDLDYVYFKENQPVYIALNPKMEMCEDNAIALIPFSGFLRDFGGKDIRSATTDSDYGKTNDIPYITCDVSPQTTVIYINSGNKTEIRKTAKNCYELTYSDCEITKVTEKFELLILDKYMSYFTREDDSFFDVFK